jgi:arginase
MDVRLIAVPYMAGDDRHPASEGPRCLLEAGAQRLLQSKGIATLVEAVDRGVPFSDTASSSAAVNRQLAAAVRRAIDAQALPLVLAGSCSAAHGVLAGFDHGRCGGIWLDAHADFNTPESTSSGFFPGMSLAIVAGHCYRDYWSQIGDATPLAENTIGLFGVRAVFPAAERDRLKRSAIEVIPWQHGRPKRDVQSAINRVGKRVREVYLHIDMDAFSPEVAPGVVDEPVPGGLSVEDAEAIIRDTGARFRIRAVTLATFTPERDRAGKSLRTALRLMEQIGDWAVHATPTA